MNNWINFKDLRTKLDFEQVLRHYGVEIKRKGNQHLGFCPLPKHDGKKNSPSFSANLERGIFQCFGCGAKGNILEFAAMMEKVSLEDGTAFRNVALELQRRFCQETQSGSEAGKMLDEPKQREAAKSDTRATVVNAPLDFELKGLDKNHPYLINRGFTPETIAKFGLGFCSRGLLKDRIAIPLHDHKGRLVGYAGRVIDDSLIKPDNPKYRFPSKRERNGRIFEFRKSRFLYNGFRFNDPLDDLIVVEGFASVWWLRQIGFPEVVATMGADCSERQAELIVALVKPKGRLWIISDGDTAGERHAHSLFELVAPYRLIRWIKLENGKQPTGYPIAFYRTFTK